MRKAPRQARSRATVDALVEAGARILGDDGWSGFTTNKVAERAGVSIGSLYQYFPDKLSLVDSIRRRHLDDCIAAMRTVRADGCPPMEVAAILVRAMIAAHSAHPGLHRVLLDEAPTSAEHRDPCSDFEVEYLSHYAGIVAASRKRRPTPADHAAAGVMSDAIDGVIHNAARRGSLGDPMMQAELVRLIGGYLAGAGEAAPVEES
ncbi:TetR/AcrR family transcriptional regulator (plasmid) [Azospirillum sp. 412522]|nr:TetR/AcrR family transcriptional regulator [Azospirillum sp. 412522]MBY6266447.1 TetR/AcrR family transcriptional regulator [Azospirillum sp. 412522]